MDAENEWYQGQGGRDCAGGNYFLFLNNNENGKNKIEKFLLFFIYAVLFENREYYVFMIIGKEDS